MPIVEKLARSLIAAILGVLCWSPAGAVDSGFSAELKDLKAATEGAARVTQNTATGFARFVTFEANGVGLDLALEPTARADSFFQQFGGVFGISDPNTELVLESSRIDELGMTHLQFRQTYSGVKVLSTRMLVHFWATGHLRAVNGTFIPDIALEITPSISEAQAVEAAVDKVASDIGEGLSVTASDGTTLYVLRENLSYAKPGENHLVYEVEVTAGSVRELVYVDAHTGQIVEQRPTHYDAIDRQEYVLGCDPSFLNDCGVFRAECEDDGFGTLLCSDTAVTCEIDSDCWFTCAGSPEEETCEWEEGDTLDYSCEQGVTPNCDTQDEEDATNLGVNNIITASKDAWNFFSCLEDTDTNWDLTSDGPMHSEFAFCAGAMARFDIRQQSPPIGVTVFCGLRAADDVVVHEWEHGYTFSTHGLVNLGQSGALNESYSDIFGEVVDQNNDIGTDAPDTVRSDEKCSEHDDNGVTHGTDEDSYRWLFGEDAERPLRDMWWPNCLGHPGKTSDEEYTCAGGTHTNE